LASKESAMLSTGWPDRHSRIEPDQLDSGLPVIVTCSGPSPPEVGTYSM
jgi:hypothetical protein